MGAWHSWRDPPRRGRLAVSAPDRDRPRRRHLHRAPSPPELAGRTARVPAALRTDAIDTFDWRVLLRAAATGADGGGLVGGADLGQERHAPVSPDAPDRATSAMRPATRARLMTPVGRRRAEHARRLRRPRRRALHRPRFPPVAVAASTQPTRGIKLRHYPLAASDARFSDLRRCGRPCPRGRRRRARRSGPRRTRRARRCVASDASAAVSSSSLTAALPFHTNDRMRREQRSP